MKNDRLSKRRVLVVAYNFPPHAAIGTMRTLRVVRQLAARGWEVSVLTGEPATYLPGTPVDAALLHNVPSRVRVVRAAAIRPVEWMEQALGRLYHHRSSRSAVQRTRTEHEPRHDSVSVVPPSPAGVVHQLTRLKGVIDALLSIPDRESGWFLPALGNGLLAQLHEARPDVIYASAPPWTSQLVAAGLKQALRRPWVADFRDPWSRAPWREDRYSFAIRVAGALERFVVARADRVVFVTAANRDEFAAYYGATTASRFEVVPNGCEPAEFYAIRDSCRAEAGRYVLLHAGTLYAGRTPLPLLNAVATAASRGIIDPARFRLRFMGANGLQNVDLPGACRQLGIEQVVEFVPRVPREQSLRAMMSASGLLLLQPGHPVSVPGKVYEYLATGRPILAIADEGEISRLMREAGTGICVAPDDHAAMVEALRTLVQMGSARREPPRELFDGNIGASQIADILERLIRRDDPMVRLNDVAAES